MASTKLHPSEIAAARRWLPICRMALRRGRDLRRLHQAGQERAALARATSRAKAAQR